MHNDHSAETLESLAQRIAGLFGQHDLPAELQRNLQALLRNATGRLGLVSRDEFDAQCAVLARTRARVEALEHEVEKLKQQLEAGDATR